MNTPDVYSGWKGVDLGPEYRRPFKSAIPTLFISGTLDSNTPVSNAEEIINDFSGGTHLVVENAGHEDMLSSEKVQAGVIQYLASGTVEATKISLPKPHFVKVF